LKLIAAFRQALDEAVYLLVTCADREGALLFLKSDIPYEVLLVDFEWRKRDGVGVVRIARKLRHRRLMPIVLVGGARLSRQTRADAEEAGVTMCVLKTQDVWEVIRRLIDRERESRFWSAVTCHRFRAPRPVATRLTTRRQRPKRGQVGALQDVRNSLLHIPLTLSPNLFSVNH